MVVFLDEMAKQYDAKALNFNAFGAFLLPFCLDTS
jgi:hypothetical protein